MMSAIEGRLQNLCDQIDTHFGVSDEELRQIFDSDSLEWVLTCNLYVDFENKYIPTLVRSLEHELIGLVRFAIVAKNEHREKPELLRQLDDRIDSVRSSVHALRMESLQRVEERHKRQRRRRGG